VFVTQDSKLAYSPEISEVKKMIKGMKQKVVKDAIIAEAKKQFLEKGVNKTTLRSIARKLDMAIGNLYYYYKSKTDICLVIWHAYTKIFLAEYNAHLSIRGEKDSGLEGIRKYYSDLYEFCRQNPLYVDLIAHTMQEKQRYAVSDPEVEELSRGIRDSIKTTLVALYERGIKDGSITAPVTNILYEVWSFNIAYIAIIMVRYNQIDDFIYEYYVNTYLERLACQ